MHAIPKKPSRIDAASLGAAAKQSFMRLTWRHQARNPVMFLVFIGALITSVIFVARLAAEDGGSLWFTGHIAFWLWFTVLFANFAEAVAEGKGKAQAETLKRARRDVTAKKIPSIAERSRFQSIAANALHKGDLVLVKAGDFIPVDGLVIEGIATIDESAITGESAPVIRESGGDRDALTGGTRVLSDWLVMRVSVEPGESFLDRMIGLVESAKRQKTPNEIALSILLAAMTLIFLLVCVSLLPFSSFSAGLSGTGSAISVTALIALLVCLIPTTIGGLLSAIGISGMQRLIGANVIATSGRAVEAAGDVNILLLDKTGTITFGNRQAVEFFPAKDIEPRRLAEAAALASQADETPEGRSIVSLARNRFDISEQVLDERAVFIPFSAEHRVSGVELGDRTVLKGAGDAIAGRVAAAGGGMPADVMAQVEDIARQGGTPLIVCENTRVLGVVYLKDVVKPDIKARLSDLRKMGGLG